MSRLRVLAWVASSICAVACADTDKPDPGNRSGAGVGASAGQAGAGASGGMGATGAAGSETAGAPDGGGAGGEAPVDPCLTTGMALAFKADVIDLVAGDLGPDLPGGNTPRTVEVWAYFVGEASWQPNHSVFELGRRVDLDNQVFGFDLAGHDGTEGVFAPYTNNLGDNDPTPLAIEAQGWHHLAWGYDGAGRFQLVVDGQDVPLANPGDGTGMLATTPGLITLGGSQNFGFEGWEGTLDELRLWTVFRSESEIARDMKVKLTGNEPGLAAYYDFDKGRGNTVDDVRVLPGHKLTVCPANGGPCPAAASMSPTWVVSDIPGPFSCAE